jgi:hypothetical protein
MSMSKYRLSQSPCGLILISEQSDGLLCIQYMQIIREYHKSSSWIRYKSHRPMKYKNDM